MTFPLVSVRIAAFNHEHYINQCLQSVLEDSYPNKELLIINDGSTDRTDEKIREWIENYKDRIRIEYESRPHRGIAVTLNELISKCRGKYIVGLGSDDFFLPEGIQARVDYLEKTLDKLAVFADCWVVDKNGNSLFESGLTDLYDADISRFRTPQGLRREIVGRWSVPGPVLMTRRDIYSQLGYYDPDLEVEDWDFYLRMVSKDVLGFLNTRVSAYRIHDTNTSRKKVASVNKELLKAALKNFWRFHGTEQLLLVKRIIGILFFMISGTSLNSLFTKLGITQIARNSNLGNTKL